MMKYLLAGFIILFTTYIHVAVAQKLMGLVVEKDVKGVDQPLPGANVYWMGTQKGATTKDNGIFLIDRIEGTSQLVISYIGYKSDTILITDQGSVKVELKSDLLLDEITVEGWRSTTHFDQSSGINLVVMDEKELFKAACCNLSESFETNPSVDVAFTDAVTGTKQIQMLGLAGPNTMISVENMPGVRGLASSQGIQFIPGTWINSIQVTKGVGSVVNGFESIAGQINVELKKPQESERLYLNGYISNAARVETNVIYTAHVGDKWATTFLLHGSARPMDMDQNNDSFMDFPMGSQVNLVNRWVYNSGTGWLGQFGVKYLLDDKIGGQIGFEHETNQFSTDKYGLEINTERVELTGKLGYQVPGKPYKSVGLQVNAFTHKHDSYFGFNVHDADENSFYSNLIYQSIIGNTQHKFKTGLSLLVDQTNEVLYQEQHTTGHSAAHANANFYFDFSRNEIVPGAFLEYTFDDLKFVSFVAGVRVDQHNLFGTIFTPRLHSKFNLSPTTTLRASAGKGTRLANLIVENPGFLASSRVPIVRNQQTNYAYGINPDVAWNYGLSMTQDFTLDYRPGVVSVEYFYTDFKNQAVIDYDQSPQEINFYPLQGRSFSHSVQVQADYQLIRRLDLRLAYRWVDVKTDYLLGQLARPFIQRDRAFMNISYATKNNWKFDYTLQWNGKQRIPFTGSNPPAYRLSDHSDPFLLMNAQVTKDFNLKWSAYLGVENISNFRLDNPIVASGDPFGAYFDSSMVWGPVFGRMAYAGFRYRIN